MTRERLLDLEGRDTGLDIAPLQSRETASVPFWAVLDRQTGKPSGYILKEYAGNDRSLQLQKAYKAHSITQRLSSYFTSLGWSVDKSVQELPGRPINVVVRENGNPGVILAQISDASSTSISSPLELYSSPPLDIHQKSRPNLPDLRHFADWIAMAKSLAYQVAICHGVGLVHGDLAPRNILLRTLESGQRMPVIIDIDNAALLEMDSRGEYHKSFVPGMAPTEALGGGMDVEWYAPDLSWRKQLPSQATDLWSLACLIYSIVFLPNRPFMLYELGASQYPLDFILDKKSVPWPPRGHGAMATGKEFTQFTISAGAMGDEIMSLFARVFHRPAGQVEFNANARPDAYEWAKALDRREKEFKKYL